MQFPPRSMAPAVRLGVQLRMWSLIEVWMDGNTLRYNESVHMSFHMWHKSWFSDWNSEDGHNT